MSLILPSWIGAIATVVLAAGAVVTSSFAIRAFQEQSRGVELLQQQLTDQRGINAEQAKVLKLQAADLRESLDGRQRDREERHREQAVRVFPWTAVVQTDPVTYSVLVRNTSDRPVYDVTVALSRKAVTQSATYTFQDDPVSVLMPNETVRIPPEGGVPWQGSPVPGETWSQVRFWDAAGVNWTVTSRGEISEWQEHRILLARQGPGRYRKWLTTRTEARRPETAQSACAKRTWRVPLR